MKNLLMEIAFECGYKDPPNKKGITVSMLIDASLSGNIVEYIRDRTGCAKQTVTNALAKSFPDRDTTRSVGLVKFLLSKRELRLCPRCETIKSENDFYTNANKSDCLGTLCKTCSKQARIDTYNKDPQKEIHKNSIRKRQVSDFQTPSWANLEVIAEFYRNRPEGHHVDHIVPLNGVTVCGLHVENNLQYLLAEDNLSKNNRFNGAID